MKNNLLSQGWEGEGAVSLISFPQPSNWRKHTVLTIPSQLPFCSHYHGLAWVFTLPESWQTWSFLLMPHPLLDDYFYSWAYSLSLILQP